MVNDVSAMEVANTIFVLPLAAGVMASCCLAKGKSPYKGQIKSGRLICSKSSIVLLISNTPGKKTSMSPSCSLRATRMALATTVWRWAVLSSWWVYIMSTGNCLPCEAMTGTLPRRSDKLMVSNVADIISMRKSLRRSCWTSRLNASARSAFKFRSWNSSKMIMPTSSKALSVWIMRVRIPSVTTSTCVVLEILFSKRIR